MYDTTIVIRLEDVRLRLIKMLLSENIVWGNMTYFMLSGRPRDPSRWAIELTECYLVHTT